MVFCVGWPRHQATHKRGRACKNVVRVYSMVPQFQCHCSFFRGWETLVVESMIMRAVHKTSLLKIQEMWGVSEPWFWSKRRLSLSNSAMVKKKDLPRPIPVQGVSHAFKNQAWLRGSFKRFPFHCFPCLFNPILTLIIRVPSSLILSPLSSHHLPWKQKVLSSTLIFSFVF